MIEELFNTGRFWTDKGNEHNYIVGYYNKEFVDRETAIKLMEIGMGNYGGSIDLWLEFFKNGNIVLIEYDERLVEFYTNKWGYRDRVKIIHADAYDINTLNVFEDNEFDYIIDDGPHTLKSHLYSATNWISKVKENGKLIIEDIQDEKFINDINKVNKYPYRIVDLRKDKGRYDDLIYEITKTIND
jgi:16S rRNA A1518/A1519 N6-dimethyltransferase RsmA/KsgA/DIM1 with predicted DNA glycosylase/AP lyase activity